MSLRSALGEIHERLLATTPGPWWAYETYQADNYVVGPKGFMYGDIVAGSTYNKTNTEFIAHSKTDVGNLVAALETALEFHKERYWQRVDRTDLRFPPQEIVGCTCGYSYFPCPERKALEMVWEEE